MTLFKIEHNAATGEIKETPLTLEEIAQKEKDEADYLAKKMADTEKAATKQALLDKLGITEEEAALLLGGN
jgi:hypothetical protein